MNMDGVHHDEPFMISRRHFLRFIAGLGAFGASTTAYGFGVEPARLKVTRYSVAPLGAPAAIS